jgi:predicted nuclease of predicted toxin-antitoxin system
MRFLVDESTGAAVAEALRSLGHDVISVSEALPQADDQEILARAVNESRIVVTNDKDFGELIFRIGQAHQGVLLLRLRDQSAPNRVRVVNAVLEQCGERLSDSYVVATDWNVRIRRRDRSQR